MGLGENKLNSLVREVKLVKCVCVCVAIVMCGSDSVKRLVSFNFGNGN
jgi:hypothetical protein